MNEERNGKCLRQVEHIDGSDRKTCGYYYEILNLTHALKLSPSYKDTASAMKKWPHKTCGSV